jgi:preprotein translocase subunit SecB
MRKSKIPPEEYQTILKGLDLKSISLIESKTKLDETSFNPEIKVDIAETSESEITNNELLIIKRYRLTGIAKDEEKNCIEIIGKFKVVYSIESKREITKDFINLFNQISVEYILWPYFRELVQSMVTRLNLPPLTLPLKKLINQY